jgi:cytochrome c peroxidase
VSIGVGGQAGGRSAPTVWNAGFQTAMFWDGRAATLEDQAKGPITNPIEMGMKSHDVVMQRLQTVPGYVQEFRRVYPRDEKPLTIDNAAKAIAAFERTLVTPNSRFDRFQKGDKAALNAQEKRGLALVDKAGCTSCHSGVNFSGPALPQGTPFLQKFPTFTDNAYVAKYKLADDPGRFNVTKVESDRNMWRVPTWRNIALTAPYFHNGSVPTLDEAVRVMAKVQLNTELANDQVQDVVAFLKTLTGMRPRIVMPVLPPTEGVTATPAVASGGAPEPAATR